MGGKWALQLFFKMNQQGVFISFIPKVIAQIHYPQFKQDNANCTVTKSTNQQTSQLTPESCKTLDVSLVWQSSKMFLLF